jgi:hypothetical protein
VARTPHAQQPWQPPWRDCRLASPRNQSLRRCAPPPALPPIACIAVVIGMRTWVGRPPLEHCQDMRVRGLGGSAPRSGRCFIVFITSSCFSAPASWRSMAHPRGEDNSRVKGLDHHIGAGAPARLPRPGARRQRSCHRAARERPRGARRASPPTGLHRASTAELVDHQLPTPPRSGAAPASAGQPPTTGRFATVRRTTRRNFDRRLMKNRDPAGGGRAMQGLLASGRARSATQHRTRTPPRA